MLGIKIRFEHIVIVVLLAIIFFLVNCNGSGKDCETETITTVTEEVITKKDSTTNNNVKNRKPHKVAIIETPEKVEIIPDPEKLTEEEKGQVKQANRYIDTTRISDGYVISDILSEGRILKLDLKTSIDHLQRTITTTRKRIKRPGGFFFSPTAEYIPAYGFSSAGAGITYINGKLGFGTGVFYDFKSQQLGFRFTIHIKVF